MELQLLPNGLLRLQEVPADNGYIEGMEMFSSNHKEVMGTLRQNTGQRAHANSNTALRAY